MVDVPLLGTVIEQNGDRCLEDSNWMAITSRRCCQTKMPHRTDLLKPTVIRPKQSSVSSVGDPSGIKVAIKEPCAGLCDPGDCSSASCRVSGGFHTKRSGKGLFNGGPVKIVLVVGGCCHDKKAVRKSGAAFEVCNDV